MSEEKINNEQLNKTPDNTQQKEELKEKPESKNEGFVCVNCKAEVTPLKMGKRDHCPHCLFSVHTDIFPNDNANTCHGAMQAVGITQNGDGEMMIISKCLQCGKTVRSFVTLDDNYDEIYKLLNHDEK